MPRESSESFSDWAQCKRALSRWDNEGGVGPDSSATDTRPNNEQTSTPELLVSYLQALPSDVPQ